MKAKWLFFLIACMGMVAAIAADKIVSFVVCACLALAFLVLGDY
jgi:hypothetical protein